MTADRFVASPFPQDRGSRMYRTGDVVRRDPDGRIAFLGRQDHQVKLRGFRVELGDVEAALRAHPAVGQAVAAVLPGPQPRLVAYLVAAGGCGQLQTEEIRQAAADRLPAYMVPSVLIGLDALPLTPNRKVDRAALPVPPAAAAPVAPRTPLEELVLRIWADVLEQPALGVEDDVFAAGATSLEATRVAARVARQLGVAVPVELVFEEPTVAALTEAVLSLELGEAEPAWLQELALPEDAA